MLDLNTILTIASIICTVASGIGAWKSIAYYNKSKQITIYANTNKSYIESKKIISSLTEILKLSYRPNQRGTNYAHEISIQAENIKDSMNRIRENMSVKDIEEIQELLNTNEINVDRYINSLISGQVFSDGKFDINEDFNKCNKRFDDLQILIRRKNEEAEKKLK